jgi:hypothetical protein
MARNCSSHPSRGRRADRTRSTPFLISSSTVSFRPACSTTTFGIRIPWEFPIRTSLAFTAVTAAHFPRGPTL